MKKRFLSMLLALCVVLTLFPVSALGANSDFTIDDGVLVKYNGSGGAVTIPNSVTSIRSDVFQRCTSLTSVIIPDRITMINSWMFAGCSSLTSVTLPSSVTYIGAEAFEDCNSLTDVYYGGSESQWKDIFIDDDNDNLISAIIHYNSYSSTEIANIKWDFDAGTGTLTIHGSGDMEDYEDGYFGGWGLAPWLENRNLIKSVVISDGITRIGDYAFYSAENMTSVKLPNTLKGIGESAFSHTALTSIVFPDSLETIESGAFNASGIEKIHLSKNITTISKNAFGSLYGSSVSQITVDPKNKAYTVLDGVLYDKNVTRIVQYFRRGATEYVIPDTVTGEIDISDFWFTDLRSIVFPVGVNVVCGMSAADAWLGVESDYIVTLYFKGEIQNIEWAEWWGPDGAAKLEYKKYESQSYPNLPKSEYIYDIKDPGETVVLSVEKLDMVTNPTTAANVVSDLTSTMTTEQKNSATGADLATLYAETAVSKAASKKVTGKEIIINKAAISDLEAVATQTSSAVETALVNGGVTTARLISNTVTLTTNETGEITIKIDPDILTTKVDKIRVEAPTYAITLKVTDLKEDLSEILAITAQDVGSGYAPGNQNKKTTVKVNLPKGKTTNPVTVSLPKDSGDTTYQAVVKTDGSATSSKYNPATTTMDGKVNTSGSYTVQTNQKDFTDIANKSAEMQNAIRYLASKGIINGTSATEFSPDGSINRAEIAALLVRALGKLDNSATNSFTDVKSSDWYYATAGSSQKCGLIKGYTDNTFRGTIPIIKDQILAVAARVLKNEMGYKEPSNPASYLTKYSDTVTNWAQAEVALATKENLVVYRADGSFKGNGDMTRGDAAIIIYRLFQKIW